MTTRNDNRGAYFTLLLGMLVAFALLAIDLYLPALPAIAAGLAATPERVELSITVFLGGFSFGMLCYGPISDRYGPSKVLLGGILLFVVASLGCMLAVTVTVEQLNVARFCPKRPFSVFARQYRLCLDKQPKL